MYFSSLVSTESKLSKRTLLTPDHREFWENLSSWVEPGGDAGIDIFCPLGASGNHDVSNKFSV